MRQTCVPELLDGAKNLLDMSMGSTGTYILKRHCCRGSRQGRERLPFGFSASGAVVSGRGRHGL